VSSTFGHGPGRPCLIRANLRVILYDNSLWTYNPSNNDKQGDAWNHENFSWFSEERRQDLLYARFLRMSKPDQQQVDDQATDLDVGGRLLDEIVVCRWSSHRSPVK
jgi:hypothetical protein